MRPDSVSVLSLFNMVVPFLQPRTNYVILSIVVQRNDLMNCENCKGFCKIGKCVLVCREYHVYYILLDAAVM